MPVRTVLSRCRPAERRANLVFGNPDEVSRTLVLSPITRLVTLTGSIHVGKHLTRLAAETMKPVLMELGGHAPVLIDEDVNHDEIAQLATNWKFRMAGQFCSAPSRFLVHRSVYENLSKASPARPAALRSGTDLLKGCRWGRSLTGDVWLPCRFG